MVELHGFPYMEVEFTKAGTVFDQGQVDAIATFLQGDGVGATDLFVISHGWNNDMADARSLYDRLFQQVRAEIDAARVPLPNRSFAIVAVLWPSKKFDDPDLIPGGGAAGLPPPVSSASVQMQLEGLKGALDSDDGDARIDQAKQLVPSLATSVDARKQFADLLRGAMSPHATDDLDATAQFFALDGDRLMELLSQPVLPAPPPPAGGGGGGAAAIGNAGAGAPVPPAGGALSLGGFLSGMLSAARKLLNFTTYYQMKARSGLVGAVGLNPVLLQIEAIRPGLKVHLIGHSFGARLVSAAAVGSVGGTAAKPTSITLLQGAFSHYGFAADWDGRGDDGFFRAVFSAHLLSGPMVVSFTKNDLAVGIAYPIASLIAGQVAAGLGDANDKYGGLGRNGAQKTPEASFGDLTDVNGLYVFAGDKVFNLNADAFIMNHSDIAKAQVAHALLSAVSVT